MVQEAASTADEKKRKRTYLNDAVVDKPRRSPMPECGRATCYGASTDNCLSRATKKQNTNHFQPHNILLYFGNLEEVVDELFIFLVMFQFAGGDVGRDVVHGKQVRGTVPRGRVVVFRHDVGGEDVAAAWGYEFFAFFDEATDLGVAHELFFYLNPKTRSEFKRLGLDSPQGDYPQSEWALEFGRSGQTHLAMHLDEDHTLPWRKAKCFDVFIQRVLLKDLSHGEWYNIWMVRLYQRKLKRLIGERLDFGLELCLGETTLQWGIDDLGAAQGIRRVILFQVKKIFGI
ncbi:hypothetical protein B0H13DRAFT_1889435 [Mycena leptocephala]|nr:hypothetical protein B0H13DRAFT_1889435 [Mycena leptocephala]